MSTGCDQRCALASVNRRRKRHDRRAMRQRLATAARTINVRNVVIRAFLSPRMEK